MTIEYPTLVDFEQISQLAREIHNQHRGYFPDLYTEVDLPLLFQSYTKMLEEKVIIVARDGKKILGYLNFVLDENHFHGFVHRKILLIHGLKVDGEFEGQGIASMLLDYVEVLAKERGCNYVDLSVNPKNVQAQQFYEKRGFMPKQISCYKRI